MTTSVSQVVLDNIKKMSFILEIHSGKQCGLIEEGCCQAPGLSWFHKTLNSTTTDYIETRVCADEVSS